MRPKELRFTHQTKLEGLERSGYRCESCGIHQDEAQLYAHHKLAIAYAHFYPEISASVISSLANLEILCRECHNLADLDAQENPDKYAQQLRKTAHAKTA